MTTTNVNAEETMLLRHDHDGIATLTLNRPNQYNCLSEALLTELQQALGQIAEDTGIRVVVIAGNGPAYCAGHDLKEMRAHTDQAFHKTLFEQCARVMLTIKRLPQPVIAKVHGIATAAGGSPQPALVPQARQDATESVGTDGQGENECGAKRRGARPSRRPN